MSDANDPQEGASSDGQDPQDAAPRLPRAQPLPNEVRRKKYLDALTDVSDGMSIRGAAKRHGISFSSLSLHVKNRTEPPSKPGGTPFLAEDDEQQLVDWCLEMSKIGCPQTRKVLPLVVQSILNAKKKMMFPLQIFLHTDGSVDS